MRPRRLFLAAAAALFAAVTGATSLHAQSDVIRGRIVGPDSLPVERATVTVTSITGNISRIARTDKNGRYQIAFPGDEGDYFVNVAALGFSGKRFEIKRTGDQEILVADARLATAAAQLDAVKVKASRDKPTRDDNRADLSGTERTINAANLSPDQLGDLAALAASLPGVQLVPSADGGPAGFSVLGLTPDQNATTLNGMNFGGSNIPRDANVSSSLVTTPYDVSRGNFSGGLLNIRTGRASNFIIRSSSANIDAPSMQWTDAAARSLGQQYANVSVSGLFAGPVVPEKAFYNFSYQLGRRQQDLQSLLNTSPLGLQTAGLAQDSVTRLLQILGRTHIPQTVAGIPSNRYTDQALVLGSFDLTPPSSTTGQAFNITYNGSLFKTAASTVSPTELPEHSGDRVNWNAGLQGRHTNYYGFGILSETSIGVNGSRNYGTPYLDLPSGTVRIASTFPDGTPSVSNIGFGGSPFMSTSVTTASGQFTNQLSWFTEDNRHRIKLTTELRRDSYAQDLTTNQLGSFTYNSLADLDAGKPAAFTRQLSPRRRSESEYIGGLSLGDAYKPSSDLQVQYGLRLDGNRFNSEPTLNPDVMRQFNTPNDQVPNKLYLSPRVGFSWTYGEGAQVAGFDGAVRGPRAVVRGGIGVFQSTPSAQSIGSAMDNTGLASAVQQLACVGVAVPTPDWSSYTNDGSIPTRCADGTSGTVFSSTAPNVTLFDKNYSAPRSLRSNLQWNGQILGNRFGTTIDATYSLNMNQPGTFDLNFNPAQRFALSSEGGRPIYAQSTSIVSSTGTIASGEGRVTPTFNHVSQLRSDMKSESRQVTVSLQPTAFNSSLTWGLAYVYANTREMYRGFSSTAGNPLDVEWSRSGFDSRHQIQYRFTYNALDWVRLGWNGSIRSGSPYTPTVGTDINGDGYANDRAFIFDPSKVATDTSLSNGLRSLMTSGSASARDCLASQLGKLAGRNSCEGPWSTTANLSVSFNPIKVRMPQRATLSFAISNPLGAADMLLHGDNVHGWGQTPIPQSQLFFVRGFDQTAQKYSYVVNQRFGSTSTSNTTSRTPVTLTTRLSFDVGPTRERQMLTQMLDRGRTLSGQKMPEMILKAYGSVGITNPIAVILRQADTLELTPQQADSMAILNRWYTLKQDSVLTPLSKYLAQLPDSYDQDEAYTRYKRAREASIDALIMIAPTVKSLLTDAQWRKLPTFVTPFLDRRYLASVRSGTAGTGLGMIMGPGGGMGMPMGGDGGGVRIMIKSP